MIFDLFDLFIIKMKDNNNLLIRALLYLVIDIIVKFNPTK